MPKQAVFRAAGQALAALWYQAPIGHVDIHGIALDWPDLPICELKRDRVLTEVAIGLAGVVAEDRYRFGFVPDGDFTCLWRFNRSQIDDVGIVRTLTDAVDSADDDDVLYRSWCAAVQFVDRPEVWRAIELVAEQLMD